METKKLEIQQAVEGEKFNKTVENFDEFKKELIINGVNDVFSSMKIKQDKTKYLFSLNGTNIFAVNGKTNVVSRLQKYYEEKGVTEKWSAEQQVLIRMEGLELQYIKSKTQDELDVLKTDIAKASNLETKTTNIENVKYKVERLITIFEQERDLAKESSSWFSSKYDKKDDNLRKIHKKEIERRLKELNKIKKQIELLTNNKGKIYEIKRDIDPIDNTKEVSTVKEVKMDDVNAMDMTMTLKQLSDRIEEIGKEVPDFITTRNDIILEKGDTNPYYEIIIHDKSDARKISKSLKKINNQYAILDKLELTAAKRQALSQDLQDLETYLNKVIDNPDTFKPSENPFVPTHAKEFAELIEIDPTLAAFTKLNTEAGKTETQVPATGAGTTETGTTEKTKTGTEYVANPYDSVGEAFEKGGIGGALKYGLDQTKMKPNQKQFWGGVGNVAMIGGIAFVGFKILQSAFRIIFKKEGYKDTKNRGWLLGPLAILGISQGVSGEGPLSLFTGGEGKLTGLIASIRGGGDKTGEKDKTETSIKYSEGFPGATAVFNGFTYGGMKDLLVQDTNGDHMKIDPDKYDALVETFKNGDKKNAAAVAFLESIGKDDDKHMMDLALKGMGVNRDNIQDVSNEDKKFNDSASKSIARLASVATYMEEKKYNKINTETEYLIEEYIADENADIDDLDDLADRGDVFYKETTVTDQTGQATEIKTLANGDTEKEEELLLAINSFYDYMPTADKKVELTGTGDEITFETYDQEVKINLAKKSLVGFTPSEFTSYLELFKAASLTNYIKKICKDKESTTAEPFHISTPGRDIEFADPSLLKIDTEIVSAGLGGSLKKISPTLETNKKDYCTYLNSLKFRVDKSTTT